MREDREIERERKRVRGGKGEVTSLSGNTRERRKERERKERKDRREGKSEWGQPTTRLS